MPSRAVSICFYTLSKESDLRVPTHPGGDSEVEARIRVTTQRSHRGMYVYLRTMSLNHSVAGWFAPGRYSKLKGEVALPRLDLMSSNYASLPFTTSMFSWHTNAVQRKRKSSRGSNCAQ